MPAVPPPAELLLRVNLASVLSDRELARLAGLAREEGSMDRALTAVIRRGLAGRGRGTEGGTAVLNRPAPRLPGDPT